MLESTKVPALTRAIEILNLIGRIGPCSAATIIAELGIPKSTVYLLLGELKKQRFISMDNQDNYCLWTKLVELAGQALSKMDLRELARPRLTRLMDECGLLCHLGIIDQVTPTTFWKIELPPPSACARMRVSIRLFTARIGKCLLAWQPVFLRSGVDYRRPTVGAGHANDHHRCSTAAGRAGADPCPGLSFDNGEDYPEGAAWLPRYLTPQRPDRRHLGGGYPSANQ
ncbi:helix-turn-helix domain-containing protein [Klebsiella pneumoniae]|nr:helix-turn-helix domain-containing protein [Klebsiella pneumoniae]